MTNLDELEDAFISLEMIIKLNTAIETNRINISSIDNDAPLIVKDGNNNLVIGANLLKTDGDFVLWSQNNIMVAFGNAAITIWEAVVFAGVYNSKSLSGLTSLNTDIEKAVGLSYMLRCCFAHGLTRPKWVINHSRYRIKLQIMNKIIDISDKDMQVFDYAHIDGYETLWLLKGYLVSNGIV